MFRKGPEFYRLGHVGKLAYLSGIPTRYHKTSNPQFQKFSSSGDKPIIITVKKQNECWKALHQIDVLKQNAIALITSGPTEEAALKAAAEISLFAIKEADTKKAPIELEWVDVGNPGDWGDRDHNPAKFDVIVFHGLTADSTPERFEKARDLIKRTEGSFRFVCASGLSPLALGNEKLRLPFDMAFKAMKTQKTRIFG
jgi:hypothetical protein